QVGLLRVVPLPRALRVVLGFLLLDYTLYIWHWLNHRAPPLWRFHAVHHIDLDLDSSTGIRFHFGELALAAGFRAAQVLLLGVEGILDPREVTLERSLAFPFSRRSMSARPRKHFAKGARDSTPPQR